MGRRVVVVCDGCGIDVDEDDVVQVPVKTGKPGRPKTADLCRQCVISKVGSSGMFSDFAGMAEELIEGQLGFNGEGEIVEQITDTVLASQGPVIVSQAVERAVASPLVKCVAAVESPSQLAQAESPGPEPSGQRELIYLSGAITRDGQADEAERDENMARLNLAEADLVKNGYEVFNPCSIVGEEWWEWHDYMRVCVPKVAEASELVVMPNWQSSRGSRLEVFIAGELGIPMRVWVEFSLGWPE